MNAPVGVHFIKLAFGRNHLRFEPETELQPQPLNFFCQTANAVWQLFLVGEPVPQRGSVVIAVAEPAVVQHHQLHACLFSFLRNGNNFVFIKLKRCGLPVICQNRAVFVPERAPGKPGAIEPVISAGHAAKPFAGINHNGLRRGKGFAGI